MNQSMIVIALGLAVCGAVGCGGGSGGLPPPSLQELVISPGSVTVDTAGSQRFTVQGKYSDGSIGAVNVTWSATAGMIDQNGFFLPPGTPTPTCLVIAKLQNGALADTANVEVTADPPANPDYPHEPPGFTRITERRFSAIYEDGWDVAPASGTTANFSIVQDQTAPRSPDSIGQVRYPAGFVGGGEPVNVYLEDFLPQTPTRVYVSLWVRFSPNWVGHPTSGVNKIIFLIIDNINKVLISAQGHDSEDLQATVFLQQIHSHGGSRRLDPNLPGSAEIVRGRWHRWELLITSNTDGQSNGVVEWWLDGVRVGSYSDNAFVGPGEPRTWEGVQWAPTWGGGPDILPVEQYEQIDHIYISGAP
jgi:hypothetical protein